MRILEKHTRNAKLLNDRYHLLQHLPENSIGAEIGVLGGDWSMHILAQVKPAKLHLIDTFYSDDYAHLKRFTKKNHETFITEKFASYGDQVKLLRGYSWNCLATFPDQYFDWLYIDAAHDYQSVKKDLEQAFLKIKPDGIIIMNDYIMYDHITKEDYGVVQATNEFINEHNFEILYLALHPQMFCDILIKRIPG